MKKWLRFGLILCALGLGAWLGCPLYELTGITCPLCGTTRALLCLLRGDLAAAFTCHPLFPLIPAGLLGILLLEGPMKGRRWLTATVVAIAAALCLMNVLRWAHVLPLPPAM